jgi:hypothetical protein
MTNLFKTIDEPQPELTLVLSAEASALLEAHRAALSADLGFAVTHEQTIQRLLKLASAVNAEAQRIVATKARNTAEWNASAKAHPGSLGAGASPAYTPDDMPLGKMNTGWDDPVQTMIDGKLIPASLENLLPVFGSHQRKSLDADIRRLMAEGKKIEAIKLCRSVSSLILRDAKDYVELFPLGLLPPLRSDAARYT